MLKNKKAKFIALAVFLALQLTYLVLVIVTGKEYFTSICLSALFLVLCFEKNKTYLVMQIGLICTVFADIFLVVLEPIKQIPAMIFFSITQICYFLRLYFNTKSKKEKLIHLILRVSLTLIVQIITIVVLKEKIDALSLVSMFYYTNLILNMIFAFIHFKKSPVFAIGLLLFLLCDTIIGLDIMASSYISGTLLEAINSFISGANWAWIFYVPSQALIAISLVRIKEKKSSI